MHHLAVGFIRIREREHWNFWTPQSWKGPSRLFFDARDPEGGVSVNYPVILVGKTLFCLQLPAFPTACVWVCCYLSPRDEWTFSYTLLLLPEEEMEGLCWRRIKKERLEWFSLGRNEGEATGVTRGAGWVGRGEEGDANYAWRLLIAWLSASSCTEDRGRERGRGCGARQTHWRQSRNSPIHWKRASFVSGPFQQRNARAPDPCPDAPVSHGFRA